MTQRAFLDRSRKLPLQDRPLVVDWATLLHIGMAATARISKDTPWLSSTMWATINPAGRFLRPVLLDFPLLRRWLDVESSTAMDYMREGFGFLEAPRNVAEALSMLTTKNCYAAGLRSHRLTCERDIHRGEAGQWVVGTCRDCLRATLWLFPDDGDPREWPFYDQSV